MSGDGEQRYNLCTGGRGSCAPSSSAVPVTLLPHTLASSVMTTLELDSGMSLGDISQFSDDNIGQMLENPPKKSGHRRVHSEIIMLPDNLYFDPGMVGPSFSDEDLVSMYLDMDKIINGSSCQGVAVPALALVPPPVLSAPPQTGGRVAGPADKSRIRHQHSQSMDGLSTIKPQMFMSGSEESFSASDSKKAMSAAKLAELALVDPKRAKRIWANRQSAARSKERKMRYIAELERKFQTLQTRATSLTVQINLLQQKDTNGLMAENNELKVRLQTIEQQVMLQDALNEGLKDEIQHMKVLTGKTMSNGRPMMNFAYGTTHYYHNNQAMHPLMAAQQFPHPHYHPHKQQLQHQQAVQHQRRDQQLQQLHQPYQELPWQPNDATLTGSNSAQLQKKVIQISKVQKIMALLNHHLKRFHRKHCEFSFSVLPTYSSARYLVVKSHVNKIRSSLSPGIVTCFQLTV